MASGLSGFLNVVAENQVNSPGDLILSGFCPLVIVRSDFSLGSNEAGTPRSEAIPSERPFPAYPAQRLSRG